MEASHVYFRDCPWQTDGQSADNGRIFDEGEAGAVEPREVEYSDIDFSRWNRNGPAGGEHLQEAAETEYAELQKDGNIQEPEENSGEESEEDVAVAIDEEETEQWTSVKGAGPRRKSFMYSNANAKTDDNYNIDCLKAWEGGLLFSKDVT